MRLATIFRQDNLVIFTSRQSQQYILLPVVASRSNNWNSERIGNSVKYSEPNAKPCKTPRTLERTDTTDILPGLTLSYELRLNVPKQPFGERSISLPLGLNSHIAVNKRQLAKRSRCIKKNNHASCSTSALLFAPPAATSTRLVASVGEVSWIRRWSLGKMPLIISAHSIIVTLRGLCSVSCNSLAIIPASWRR
ncbi:hypothetical protein D3C85_1279260 [compost metagenome]